MNLFSFIARATSRLRTSQRFSFEDNIAFLLYLVLYGYACLIAFSSLWWPMGRDQGILAWVGDTILNGGLPYRDAWDVKGPASHYVYALVGWLFGRNQWGIRLLDLLLVFAASLALWRLLRCLRSSF